MESQLSPQAFGYSQAMSIAVEDAASAGLDQRWQDEAKRPVRAAAEANYNVQPRKTRRFSPGSSASAAQC